MRAALRAVLLGGQAAAPPALSVSLVPSTRTWLGEAGAWSTGFFTPTVLNATGSVAYLWTFVSDPGGVSYFNEGDDWPAANTLGNDGDPNPGTVTAHLTVTDTLGSAVSNTVTIS